MASHHSSSSSRVSGYTSHTNRELKAELVCQMQSLRKKHELDKLDEEIRWKREMLQIETQLAMFNAKIDVLESDDGSLSTCSSRCSH